MTSVPTAAAPGALQGRQFFCAGAEAAYGSLGVSPSRFAERSRSLGVSPGRFAERSLRHPGFAHSCILAFALRAALDCKAGSFGPGSPLAYGFKDGLSAAFGVGLRPGRGGRKRDGSSGAAGTSAVPRPLRGPRIRPVPTTSFAACRAGPPAGVVSMSVDGVRVHGAEEVGGGDGAEVAGVAAGGGVVAEEKDVAQGHAPAVAAVGSWQQVEGSPDGGAVESDALAFDGCARRHADGERWGLLFVLGEASHLRSATTMPGEDRESVRRERCRCVQLAGLARPPRRIVRPAGRRSPQSGRGGAG